MSSCPHPSPRPNRASFLLTLVATLGLSSAITAQPSRPTNSPASPLLASLIDEYMTDSADLRSFYTIGSSPTTRARTRRHDEEWLARLDAMDFDTLAPADRIDHLLLVSHIEHRRLSAERRAGQLAELAELLDFSETICALEEGRWTLQAVTPEDAAGQLDKLAQRVEALTERVVLAQPDATHDEDALALDAVSAQRAAGTVDGLLEALSTWFDHDAAFRPDFRWWVEQPYTQAHEALVEYARKLREDVAGQKGEADDPLVGDPVGAEGLAADLMHEFMPYDAGQLLTIGEGEFAWCEQRMLEASRELGHGEDWKAALAAVKELHADPGQQDELVMSLANEAIRFLDERELVTIPPLAREFWRVRMLSRERQRVLPFAAYNRQHMLVAFPTEDMEFDTKLQAMRGNNEHFTRIVTPHELIPGHHLQGFMSARHNVHRRHFSTPFYGEGWALYWEMLLWDEGWARGPEDRIGMLFWRMHRAARIVVSLRFHLGTMTPDEMIDYLVERVGHERDNATAEVRRYIGGAYSPLYQCAYMIGGLQLRALAAELLGSGALTARQFHDAVLRCGSIPIELVRATLTGRSLEVDHEASWLFVGAVSSALEEG